MEKKEEGEKAKILIQINEKIDKEELKMKSWPYNFLNY